MSKFCEALGRRVLYLECLECDDRVCEKKNEPTITILPKKEKHVNSVDLNSNTADDRAQEPQKITHDANAQHSNCDTCCHKCGECQTTMFGRTFQAVQCEIYRNRVFTSDVVAANGCEYHNKDVSQLRICLNCENYLGGGDWGLACRADYYKLPSSTSEACEKFARKEEPNSNSVMTSARKEKKHD